MTIFVDDFHFIIITKIKNMAFISEEQIEQVIEQYYDSDKKFYKDREALMSGQPAFAALLTDEGFELLTDDEYELLCFIATVIHTAAVENHGSILALDQEKMEELDEANWTVMEDTSTTIFRERLTPFFENYPQEDLLAFVEDSLESDEDITVTPAARELIFVACKSLIDALIESGL
jgi:hypothetical protein